MTEVKTKARAPKRGEASLGVNQKAALWRDIVKDAKEHPDLPTRNAARRMVADRLWPKQKPIGAKLELVIPKNSTLDQKLNLLLDAALTGVVDIDSATQLINAIGSTYAIKANNEMLEKFEALEKELQKWREEKLAGAKPGLRRSKAEDESEQGNNATD